MEKIKLFCLPYAGGSSMVFNRWERYLSNNIELVGVELAGRGKRSNESLYENVNEAINDIYGIIAKQIVDGQPYAIYGHSMGSMLAYEVAQKISINKLPEPLHVFFSGRGAPHLKSSREKEYHSMEEKEFEKAIIHLGGTPKEFFEHPELMEYLIPVLKSDFKISETAVRSQQIIPLNYDITIMVGKEEDEIEAENVHGWHLHTSQLCTVYYFNGGHFFINNDMEKVTGILSGQLAVSNKAAIRLSAR